EKMERVCYNLLSNALKYTPANGTVTFSCKCDGKELCFSVGDTGNGISEADCTRIFDRFFQVDKVRPKGSGIGLSLVKAFVELHGGSIDLKSELGKGSVFTVIIPVTHCEAHDAIDLEDNVSGHIEREDVEAELGNIDDTSIEFADERPLVLIIDDNGDLQVLLRTVLGSEYNVITASDGKQGLHLAARYTPDVILCDVMMPGMDGLECCRHLKEEVSTSHIPVLMLTACSADEQRAAGYDSGADGYLAKPFDTAVLLARITSLIKNRKIVRNLWEGGTTRRDEGNLSKPVAVETEKPKGKKDVENEFYAKFVSLVEKEMGNPDLNVDQLASEMGLGRSQFYRKIKALTNYSPVELLRNMRLKRARHLLTTTDKSISEIGYEVGFSNPAYFSKCYREAFDETPSDLRSRL
ncbi:MAG: response regulator, partial [Muribaculaceae bacterium]|nr:response regulator [Muribaculaceae bacterium]